MFTFTGHGVLQTLIRCQFSPIETTGQRYVYTGSSDGKLRIYDLISGGLVQSLPESGSSSGQDVSDYYYHHQSSNGVPARDVSWHPHYPVIASTSFDSSVKIWTLQTKEPQQEQPVEESKQSSSQA